MSEELHERIRDMFINSEDYTKDKGKVQFTVLFDEDDFRVIKKIARSYGVPLFGQPFSMTGRISDIIAGMCHYVIDSKRKEIESESISAALLHDKLFKASSNLFDNSTRSASDLLEESRKIASEAILERDNQ